MRQSTDLVFRETSDFSSMRKLALESGLEDGSYTDFVQAYGFFDGNELVACAGLKVERDVFTIECLAVKEQFRGTGLGRYLVKRLEEEASKRGASKVWALARAPAFFVKIGYNTVSPEPSEGPNLAGCLNCKQYRRGCNPSVVLKQL